jgi:hypothetical protein
MESAPAICFKMYCIQFATMALVLQAKSGINAILSSADGTKRNIRRVWVASPILEYAVPDMVRGYHQRRVLITGRFRSYKPVCPQGFVLSVARRSLHHGQILPTQSPTSSELNVSPIAGASKSKGKISSIASTSKLACSHHSSAKEIIDLTQDESYEVGDLNESGDVIDLDESDGVIDLDESDKIIDLTQDD